MKKLLLVIGIVLVAGLAFLLGDYFRPGIFWRTTPAPVIEEEEGGVVEEPEVEDVLSVRELVSVSASDEISQEIVNVEGVVYEKDTKSLTVVDGDTYIVANFEKSSDIPSSVNIGDTVTISGTVDSVDSTGKSVVVIAESVKEQSGGSTTNSEFEADATRAVYVKGEITSFSGLSTVILEDEMGAEIRVRFGVTRDVTSSFEVGDVVRVRGFVTSVDSSGSSVQMRGEFIQLIKRDTGLGNPSSTTKELIFVEGTVVSVDSKTLVLEDTTGATVTVVFNKFSSILGTVNEGEDVVVAGYVDSVDSTGTSITMEGKWIVGM